MFRRTSYFQDYFTIGYFKIKTNLKFVCLKKKYKKDLQLTKHIYRMLVHETNYIIGKKHWSRSI